MIPDEAVAVLRDLNSWWQDPQVVLPVPPPYRRLPVREIGARIRRGSALIEVLRGPRQVGKTTGIHQIIQDLLAAGTPPRDILFVRFDLEVLREGRSVLLRIVRWFSKNVSGRPLGTAPPPFLFLDEVHKLPRWHDQVKHLRDTFPVAIVLTGSSSVLVAKGGRESLTGRIFSTEIPAFGFREVLEAWHPDLALRLPPRLRFTQAFEENLRTIGPIDPEIRSALDDRLDRYYLLGGYPRLHTGEVAEEVWAEYMVQTIFENVLGADIPDLYPVQEPRLLRHVYLSLARLTGNEVSQPFLTQEANTAGYRTTQPTVGKYVRYLADAHLIREFRRYPLGKRASARTPSKITLSDLGVRNAIFRGAPSLRDSDPVLLGPLVETLVQGVIRDHGLQVHFWRDYDDPGNRRSPVREVDFVAERVDGTLLPVEVKFRRKIGPEDAVGMRTFLERFDAPYGIVVTRDLHRYDDAARILYIPLLDFLLAF